jgi:multiple antibiotic resistance protein
MNVTAILSVSLVLFSVIDIIGSLPVIISMKREGIVINPLVATSSAGIIMICFLFFGVTILSLLGIEVSSFALAGSLIILFIGLEMILGIRFFRNHADDGGTGSVVPIAFPLLAGAGTLTTIISLKAEYDNISIIVGIIVNLIIIFIILRSTDLISRKMSAQIAATLRKFFGIVLIAIAIQMIKKYIFL